MKLSGIWGLILSLVVFFNWALIAQDPEKKESETEFSFENVSTGKLPAGWKIEATNPGKELADWQVVTDKTAPSGQKVLSLLKTNNYGSTYNLCWTDKISFTDGEVEVKFKANSGREDQGGGVIWRAQDRDNYYIARMNPLENNFRIYFVKDAHRKMLASARIEIPTGEWHELEITHRGTEIAGYIDGKKLLELEDNTFPEAGGVGLWTKADAATSFDEFEVEMKYEEHEEDEEHEHENNETHPE